MFVRLTLLALSTLALAACDGNPLQTSAREVACHCPATAPPAAAAAPTRTARAEATRQRATGARMYRVRTEPVVARESGSYGYQSSEEGLSGGYGGRYGARGGYTAGGVAVSVQQSDTASSRYSYSESSSRYGAGSASGGGYAYSGGGMQGGAYPPAPQQPAVRYKSASTTPGGWLEWPGKVED